MTSKLDAWDKTCYTLKAFHSPIEWIRAHAKLMLLMDKLDTPIINGMYCMSWEDTEWEE